MAKLLKRNSNTVSNTTNENSTNKWAMSISDQLSKVGETINVKFIPLEQIIISSTNPRKLKIDQNIIHAHISAFREIISSSNDLERDKLLLSVFQGDKEIYESAKNITELAISIQNRDNLLNPITVFQDQMKFYLIAGHRRYFAHLLLEEKLIKASILSKKPSLLEYNIIQWQENSDRDDLTLHEKIKSIENIIMARGEENHITVTELSNIINKGNTLCSMFLKIIQEKNTNALYKEALDKGYFHSIKIAYAIASSKTPSKKKQILEKIILNQGKSADILKMSKRASGTRRSDSSPTLGLSKVKNLEPIKNVINAVINSDICSAYKNEFEDINLTSKQEIISAWDKLFKALLSDQRTI